MAAGPLLGQPELEEQTGTRRQEASSGQLPLPLWACMHVCTCAFVCAHLCMCASMLMGVSVGVRSDRPPVRGCPTPSHPTQLSASPALLLLTAMALSYRTLRE